VSAPVIETDRVKLRHWQDEDLASWISMNADAETLVYFPRTVPPEISTEGFHYEKQFLLENDCGLWAAEEKSSGKFMGFVGIAWIEIPTLEVPECREIGWRLAKEFWGKGYATEAARAVLKYACEDLGMHELYSVTSILNKPSINVMQKIGLRERADLAFMHPRVPKESPLRPHVVYSL